MQEADSECGLGVVFNIEALEEEIGRRARAMHEDLDLEQAGVDLQYGRAAWRVFMKLVPPQQIAPCALLDGDTQLTLDSYQNEFCIAIYGFDLDLESLRQRILEASDYGLAPFHRRLIEKIALDQQPLVEFGRIDSMRRLVTSEWTRRDHDLCKEAGWLYAPERVPAQLDPDLAAELAEMGRWRPE